MLLTITTTTAPATDLGYLLHKHPARVQAFDLAFGQAHVLYPEASDARCTAALLLDVDPVGLVRQHRGPAGEGQRMEQYVNDRPYVASSLLSVAIARVLGSALGARCPNRPELVDRPLALQAKLAVLPARRGGEELVRRLFEPLGYDVAIERHALDERFTDWGDGPYITLTLHAMRPLHELLNHLYVLIPVLDNDKHYWVGQDEVAKLLKRGEGWLPQHPERELITARYLRYFSSLTRDALARLSEADEPDPDAAAESHAQEEEAIERPMSLNEQRHAAVLAALKGAGVRRVLDLGCA
ncbi:MAG: 3' terminal RNA ribose 2'-O-methyltransferase Hen1 [Phycisphaeraceae bacterium]